MTAVLGREARDPITIDELDVWACPRGLQLVTISSDELDARCPVTGQPDHYSVRISYDPHTLIVESKSLKLYLMSFRDEPVSCETLCARIADELAERLHCVVEVELRQNVRGGLQITAHANAAH